MMDTSSKAELDRIIAVGPDSITEPDIEFLRARSSYLTEEQRHVFAAVLAESPTPETPEAEAETEAKPRSRK